MSTLESVEGPSILVIDDDRQFREKIVSILAKHSKSAMPFESGQHVLRFIKDQPWSWTPQVVITDIAMDGMGGYQLMKAIAQLYPKKSIPMIVVSKLTHPDYRHEANAAGASAFLGKPVRVSELLKTIEKVTTVETATLNITDEEKL
ncbi:MAG: response regulator [Deltaproteobacteria bacterium]|nr:response regulator [Deltaproteobacteria bacterium]